MHLNEKFVKMKLFLYFKFSFFIQTVLKVQNV